MIQTDYAKVYEMTIQNKIEDIVLR